MDTRKASRCSLRFHASSYRKSAVRLEILPVDWDGGSAIPVPAMTLSLLCTASSTRRIVAVANRPISEVTRRTTIRDFLFFRFPRRRQRQQQKSLQSQIAAGRVVPLVDSVRAAAADGDRFASQ